jgi:hypothetical protein
MANLDGFLGKLEVTNEIGETLDKQLQLAESQVQQYVGGNSALRMGAIKVGELGVHVDKDLNEGKLSFESELVAAAYIKGFIRKAGEVLLNLADKAKSEELVAHGRVASFKESLEVVKKHCTVARARAEQLVAQAQEAAKEVVEGPSEAQEGDRRNRRPGQHPGPSSLDERRAEQTTAKASTEVSSMGGSSEPPSTEVAPEVALVEPSQGEPLGATTVAEPQRMKRPYKRKITSSDVS